MKRLIKARNSVFVSRRTNLRYLLKTRYDWIKTQVTPDEKGVEFGAGAGHSKFFIGDYNLITTDIRHLPWLDFQNIDAINSGFTEGSFDYIILMNVLHHLDKPVAFFEEARRILKPGGKLILFEPYASVTFKLALQIVGHEHCNDSADIFSETYSLNTEARNFWDGNNSTAKILFRDVTKFSERFPDFEITHRSFAELFIFLNSGGVYTNTFHIPVPLWFNRFKHKTDKMLIKISPDMFALAIRLVLRKKLEDTL